MNLNNQNVAEPAGPPPPDNDATLFDEVISPLSRQTFLSEVWGKTFYRLPGQKGKFAPYLSWDEINAMLEQDRIQPPYIWLVQDGKPLPLDSVMTFRKGLLRLRPASLLQHLGRGASLILDRIDELAPGVRRIAEAFEETLETRTNVNLYAGWRTQKGLDLHWDAQDTLILQVSGRKHWKIYKPTHLHPLQDSHVEGATPPPDPPVWDGMLEDGDAIYMPRGWWHVAYPVDEPSLHLTVTIVPPNGVDLLRWLAGRIERHPEVRMNVPNIAGPSSRKAYLSKIRELVAAALTDDSLDSFCDEWNSQIPVRPRVRLPLGPTHWNAALTDETPIRLAANRRLFLERPAEDSPLVSFYANATRWECSPDFVPALKKLRSNASITVGELCAALPAGNRITGFLAFLTSLVMGGAVWAE